MASKKIIIANWKLNPSSMKGADQLARGINSAAKKLRNTETVICPPFPWLFGLSLRYGKSLQFGSQNIFWEESGAYTGEVSSSMVVSSGAKYAIIGHSERRRVLKESDEQINRKMHASLRAGLVPILCVGEWSRRGKSMRQVQTFIKKQLVINLKGVRESLLTRRKKGLRVIVAYEPVWAISSMGGEPDTPESAGSVVRFIRKFLFSRVPGLNSKNTKTIYGGSVNAANAAGFFAYDEIEGALIGGASLKISEFSRVLEIAEKHS